jgi:hypothetical protein
MRNPAYEQALRRLGVKHHYEPQVAVEDINVPAGRRTQARLHPIDDQLVDTYAEMLEEGSDPPPLILWRQGKGRYVPLDGNQRLAANEKVSAKKRRKHFDAYIIESGDQMVVDRVCWTFNNYVHGRRLTYEECMQHALTFVKKYGQSQEQAVKEWGVKKWELVQNIIDSDMRELAAKNNLNIPDATTKGVIVTLHGLRKLGDDIVVKAMKACVESGVGVEEARELTQKVSHASTNADKLKAIDAFAEAEHIVQRKAETKGGKTRPAPPPRVMLQTVLDKADRLFANYKDKRAFKASSKEEQAKYRDIARVVANGLIEVYGLGGLLREDVA